MNQLDDLIARGLPNPNNITLTIGVMSHKDEIGTYVQQAVYDQYQLEPDEDTTGGNDKRFFVVYVKGVKLFAAENEIGGLTVMLPEEY